LKLPSACRFRIDLMPLSRTRASCSLIHLSKSFSLPVFTVPTFTGVNVISLRSREILISTITPAFIAAL